MRRPVDPKTYAHLVVNHGDPKPQQRLDPPRRAVVTARVYGGNVVTLELDVISRARGYVCVRQERDGAPPWLAWIPDTWTRPVRPHQA